MAPREESLNSNERCDCTDPACPRHNHGSSSSRPRGYTTTNTRCEPASEDSPGFMETRYSDFVLGSQPSPNTLFNTAPTKVPADTPSKKKKEKPNLTSPPRLPPHQEQEARDHEQRFGGRNRAYSSAHDSYFRTSDDDSEVVSETERMRDFEDRYGPNPGYPSRHVFHHGAAQYNRCPPARFRAGEYQPEPGQLPAPTTFRDDFRGDNLYRMPPINAYSGPGLFGDNHHSYTASDSVAPESEVSTVTPENFEHAHGDPGDGLDRGRPEGLHNAVFPGQLPPPAVNEINDWNIHDPWEGRHPSPPINLQGRAPDSGNTIPSFPDAPRHIDMSETNYSGTTLVGRGPLSSSDISRQGKKPGKPRFLAPVPSVPSSDSDSDIGPISIKSSVGDIMFNVPFEPFSELQKGLGAPKQRLGYDTQGRTAYFNIPGTGKGLWAERKPPPSQPRKIIHLHDGDCYDSLPEPQHIDCIEKECGCAQMVDYRPEPTPLTAWFKENGIETPVIKNKNLFGDRGWLQDTAAQDKPAQSTARIRNALGAVFKSAKTIATELRLATHAHSGDQNGASSRSRVREIRISLRPRDQAAIIMEIEVTCVEALTRFLHLQDLQNRTDASKMKKIDDAWAAKGNVRPAHWRYSLQVQIEIMIVHIETFRFFGPAQNNLSIVAGLLHSAKQNARAIAKRSYGQPDSVIAKQMHDFYDFLELIGAPEPAIQAITNATLFFRIIVEREDIMREAQIKIRKEHNNTLDGHRDTLAKTPLDNREKMYQSLQDPCERTAQGTYFENNGVGGVISADAFDEAARRLGRYEEAQAYMIRKTAEAREKGIVIDSPVSTAGPPSYQASTAVGKNAHDKQQFVVQPTFARTQPSTQTKSFQASETNLTMGVPYEQTVPGVAPAFVKNTAPCTPTRGSLTNNDGPPQLPMPSGIYFDNNRNLSSTQLFEVSPFDSSSPFVANSTAVSDDEHAEQLALARREKAVDTSHCRPFTPSIFGPSDSPRSGHGSGSFVTGTHLSEWDVFDDVPLYDDTARAYDAAPAPAPAPAPASRGGFGFSTQTPSAGPSNLRQQYTLDAGEDDADKDDESTITGNAYPHARPSTPQDVSPEQASSSRFKMAARRVASYKNMR